jgi:RimJ/RimL family protein N-acetyltransferase
MEIVTARLVLREFVEADAPSFAAYHADPRHARFYTPEEAEPARVLRLLGLFRGWACEAPRSNYQLAIATRGAPSEVIGCAGIRREGRGDRQAELGIELAPEHWGKGYATEATTALLAFGFRDLDLWRITADSVDANERIARLLLRLGFEAIGTRPGTGWMRARGWSHAEWLLTRDRWSPPTNPEPEPEM